MCGPYTGSAVSHGSYPINHVGVSVPDLDKAIEWYNSVLGFHKLREPSFVDRTIVPDAGAFHVYPASLQKLRIGFLSTGNGVGFELFQFVEPSTKEGDEANFEKTYTRGGYFHIAITVPDCDETINKIVANGGRLVGKSVPLFDEFQAAYVTDPWGNVIELITGSFERIMSNR
ncbi:hypothetical protein SCUCBS95973_008698 [Sporothrix curviconia]|uniref:VOC domain-containing protein n=1 Tax=Sporothrix curviconia TaxID=1260050 RepID=A0ABP0CNS9_9PEZI